MQDQPGVRESALNPADSAAPAFTALVLAGTRATGDPLAAAAGVAHKALVTVGGTPMLARVLDTLHAARSVRRVVVCGMPPELAERDPVLREIGATRRLELAPGGGSPAASVARAIESLGLEPPLLITTADHPLLTATTVDEFCEGSRSAAVDVTFGIAPAALVAAAFPGIRRTHYRFRDGDFCGCNLYAFLTAAGCTAPAAWMRVEQYRKRPWRMVGFLGPLVLVRFLLGRLALADLTAVLRRQFHVHAQPVQLSAATAGFDVDTVEQRRVADDYLRRSAALRS